MSVTVNVVGRTFEIRALGSYQQSWNCPFDGSRLEKYVFPDYRYVLVGDPPDPGLGVYCHMCDWEDEL